jgi:endonuclease YncB( thermonuclease family)
MAMIGVFASGPGMPKAPATSALYGTVTRVSDGDTLWLVPEGSGTPGAAGKSIKFRLKGIDAPEVCQSWGKEARAALTTKLLGRRVQWQSGERDDYDRRLGHLWLDGEDVGAWMVSEGHAWSYRHRGLDGPYSDDERAAKQARRGLFSNPNAIQPRRFRQSHGPCS